MSSRHPLGEALTLGVAIGVAALVCLSLLVVFADAIAIRISPETEVRTFGGTLAGLGDPTDPRLPEVQRVLEELIAVAPANGYTYRLRVIAGEPNAAAVIGGTLLVTTGLLDEVQSENELAFVLAHELGHFAGRDQIRGLSRALVGQLVLGALVGRTFGGDATDLVAHVGRLELLRHSREQEYAADRFALGLLARRYGHVGGAADFFQRISGPDGVSWSWLSSHPVATDRIQAIARTAAEHGWPTDGSLRALPASFEAGRP